MTRRIVLSIVILIASLAPSYAVGQDRPDRPSHAMVMERLNDARRMLSDARIGTTRIGGDNAVLAVWSPSSPTSGIRLVNVLGGTSRTRGFTIELLVRNGVNSQYRVTAPEGWIVLAIRTNVRGGRSRGSEPAIYAPYNPALHTPEMERDGRAYLESLMASARRRLESAHAASRVDRSLLVPAVIPDRVLLSLLIIEHVDPGDFSSHGAEWSASRVFVTAALNRGEAYRHAGSYAGALGLAQFIRGTYALTRTRYAEVGLPRDFRAGMTDHVHAVVAQYCLADWSLTRLTDAHRTRLRLAANAEDMGAFLAAAYNGGEDRAARALADDPIRWEREGHGLASQTVGYVREFRETYRFLGL